MKRYMLDKHYMRKHGPDAYYGQSVRNDILNGDNT
jgi:hypothetical protein